MSRRIDSSLADSVTSTSTVARPSPHTCMFRQNATRRAAMMVLRSAGAPFLPRSPRLPFCCKGRSASSDAHTNQRSHYARTLHVI